MNKSGFKILLFSLFISIGFTQEALAQQGVVVVNQDQDIDALLRLKKETNKTHVKYRISIYNGNRAGAEKAKLEFRKAFSDWKTDMKYEAPYYRIYVGKFKTRIEMDRALLKIKKKYPNAFPVKPKKG